MGIRETLNQKPAITTSVAAIFVLVFLGIVGWQLFGGTDPRLGTGNAFYTVDDGQTFFLADSSNIAPFDYNGKPAVQALVYSADGGKTRFVGYLQRFTPVGRQKMIEKRKQLAESKRMPSLDPELMANTEVKRPGEKNWVKLSDVATSSQVTLVVEPNNPSKPAEPVEP